MADKLDSTQQLAEIHKYIEETKAGWPGGAILGLVWALLTMAALMIVVFVRLDPLMNLIVWIVHNALGYSFTSAWYLRKWRRTGRYPLRERLTLRLSGAVAVGMWVSVLMLVRWPVSACGAVWALVGLWLGMLVFGIGLINDSRFAQILGIGWMAVVGITVLLLPGRLSTLILAAGLGLFTVTFGIGMWLAERNEQCRQSS